METTEEEITTLSESVDDMFSAREIADAWSQITALGEKYAAYQNGYTQLLGMLGEGSPSLLSVIEPATVPANPVGARKELTVLLAGAIGCALAMGGAFLLEYLDDTLKTAEDVTESLGLSTLGAIVRIEGETIHDILVTADRRLSPVSEAYRSLRTNLQFSSLDEPLQSLLVTSATAVEGKSVTVANLGVVMAQAGLSVIIVDGDLRRPVLHRVFQVPNDEGLSGALLRSNPSLDGHLQATEVDNLRLLPTGPLPPNPSELLGSRRMKALVQELESQSDLLIFDSSPCLAVTDAAVLASQVDGVLLVVEAGATRRGAALQALESLKGVGANVVGVVLTKVPPRTHSYYRYGYYSRGSDKRSRRRRRGKAVG